MTLYAPAAAPAHLRPCQFLIGESYRSSGAVYRVIRRTTHGMWVRRAGAWDCRWAKVRSDSWGREWTEIEGKRIWAYQARVLEGVG
jgi:hypothetical protein